MAYTPTQRRNAMEVIDQILYTYVDQSEAYQAGYGDAQEGINDNPYNKEAEPEMFDAWIEGHLDGVLVQRYLEGEFDE